MLFFDVDFSFMVISAAPSGKLVKNPPRVKYQKSAMITRSSSTGVLNQSDSENEADKKRQSRLMRPTISSQNKIINNKSMLNRKRQSHSTSKSHNFFIVKIFVTISFCIVNLLSVGQDDLLSTSDDEEKIKPVVPPRNRLNGGDMAAKRHQSLKDKTKINNRNGISERKKSDELDRTLTNDLQDYDSLDVSTVQRKLFCFFFCSFHCLRMTKNKYCLESRNV